MAEQKRKFSPVKIFSTCSTPPDVDVSKRSPIIFIHGFGANNRSFKQVNSAICKETGRRSYAIDLRNHGRSEWPDEVSLELMIDDLENFMVTEAISKAVLVGHSVGGRVALGLALRKPEMVDRLVAEDTCLEDTENSLGLLQKMATSGDVILDLMKFLPSTLTEIEAQKKVLTFVQRTFPEWFGSLASNAMPALPFHKTQSGAFEWDVDMQLFSRIGPSDYHLFSVNLENDPVYDGEMMALMAENSLVATPKAVGLYNKYFPKCRVHTMKGGHHTLHAEFPLKYIEVVSKFINGA